MDNGTQKYRFRLTSSTRRPGAIGIDAAEASVELPDERTLFIVARDSATLASAKRIHFEAGGYDSEQSAKQAGEHLRSRLRILNASLSLGLNIPTSDTPASSLVQSKKDEALEKHGVHLMDSVSGVLVFPDDEKHAEFTMCGEFEVAAKDPLYWLSGLRFLWASDISFDERSEDAVTFLGMAALEDSPRSAFLLAFLALERLQPTRKRSLTARRLLERLQDRVKKAAVRKRQPILQADRDSLLGSIGRLEYESFGGALIRLARANEKVEIEGLSILKFVKKCIDTRHRTAHPSGPINPSDYASLTAGLRHLVSCLIWNKHSVPDMTLQGSASSIRVPPGGLRASIVTYKRR